MSTVIVRNGDLVPKDPADAKVYTFDWDTENLATGVTIVTSVFKIAAVGSRGSDIVQSITSITRSSTTATVTTDAAHGLSTDDWVTIAGAEPDSGSLLSPYNGTFQITVTNATTFTYTVSGSPSTPASGTLVLATGIDNVSILSTDPYNSRYTIFRFTGGILGATYEIANTIVTSESPAQRKERSFRISIEDQ